MMYAKRRCSNSNALKSSTALERAKAFRTDNPSFIRAMGKSYIERSVLVQYCYNIALHNLLLSIYFVYGNMDSYLSSIGMILSILKIKIVTSSLIAVFVLFFFYFY